jgi:hypothetical protein
MKINLSTSEAAHLLLLDDNASWSYEGAHALIDYLEENFPEMEFDRVAIRCDYSEYENAREAASQYSWEADKEQDEDDQEEDALDYLQNQTMVIELASGGVVIQEF